MELIVIAVEAGLLWLGASIAIAFALGKTISIRNEKEKH